MAVLEPQTLAQYLIRANELRSQKQHAAALALYRQALEHFGEQAEVLAAGAHCYFALALEDPYAAGEKLQSAVSWMEKAVAHAPQEGRLHALLAAYYVASFSYYQRAAQEYRIAIDLNPDDVWALSGAAGLYGVPEPVVTLAEAIGWLEHAARLEPDEPVYQFRLGELYQEANRAADAERVWLKALTCPQPLDPGQAQIIEGALGGGRNGRQPDD
jgi:tetratricopeptide (TPR) repeat protein